MICLTTKLTGMPSQPLAKLESRIGESRRTVEELTVEAGKVEEFARAIHDPKPEYLDQSSAEKRGYDRQPAPPTFLRTWYFQRYRPSNIGIDYGFDLGLDPGHTVHGEQSYEFERPVFVGDTLSAETTFTDVYQRTGDRGGKMTFVVFETTFTDSEDEVVARIENTRIETGAAIEEGDDD